MAGANVTDLQSILATLSQFSSQQHSSNRDETQVSDLPQSAATPKPLLPDFSGPELSSTWAPKNELQQVQNLTPQSQAGSVATLKPIDPATILTWQEGIRCVTKIAAQNERFGTAIRKMMEEQRRHEILWYKERQALKQTQLTRTKSSAQAMSILQSLGGQTPDPSLPESHKPDPTTELLEYDRKVYAAQQRMELAMTAELKGLGVPFFGTHENLVAPDTSESSRDQTLESGRKVVTESDMLSLRRRMVGHLEDLYRD